MDVNKLMAALLLVLLLAWIAGAWKTPTMVARYTEHLQARRGDMSQLAAKQDRL